MLKTRLKTRMFIMLKRFIFALSTIFLISSAYGAKPYIYMGLGVGLSNIGKSQEYSPTSGLLNYYDLDNKTKLVSPIISLGTGYRFDVGSKLYFDLGVEGDYVNFGDPKGTMHPGINIQPNFDTSSYSYSASSVLLMAQGRFGSTDRRWFPYVSLGIGLAFNMLGSYQETLGMSTAPAKNLYKANVVNDLAYSIGIGLFQYNINKDLDFNIGYRFVYSGYGSLKNSSSNSESLSSGALSAHFITLSLTIL